MGVGVQDDADGALSGFNVVQVKVRPVEPRNLLPVYVDVSVALSLHVASVDVLRGECEPGGHQLYVHARHRVGSRHDLHRHPLGRGDGGAEVRRCSLACARDGSVVVAAAGLHHDVRDRLDRVVAPGVLLMGVGVQRNAYDSLPGLDVAQVEVWPVYPADLLAVHVDMGMAFSFHVMTVGTLRSEVEARRVNRQVHSGDRVRLDLHAHGHFLRSLNRCRVVCRLAARFHGVIGHRRRENVDGYGEAAGRVCVEFQRCRHIRTNVALQVVPV